MDIHSFASQLTPAFHGVAVQVRRPAENDPVTQPGEGPEELTDGVKQSAAAANDESVVRRRQEARQQTTEQQLISQLAARDREVRAHEDAHRSAAGAYFRGLSLTYQRGPDGVRYAVGGEVQIDRSPVPGNPEATLRKMETVQRAALAPAQPSAQDQRVAAEAAATAAQARAELLAERLQTQRTEAAPEEPEPEAGVDVFA